MTTINQVLNEVEAYADSAVEAFKASLKVDVLALATQMKTQQAFNGGLSPSMITEIDAILDKVS